MEELHNRLVEAPHADKTKGWISKPTVRSFNDWIQGGIEKLIQGDETGQGEPSTEGKKSLEVPTVGPFSHYSAISSASPSTAPSPSPSFSDLRAAASVGSPYTPSGTGGYRPPPTHSSTLPLPPPQRAASALDYGRDKPSAAPKVLSAGATMTSFAQSAASNQYQGSKPPSPTNNSHNDQDTAARPLYAQWWGESAETDGATPTASSFTREDDNQDGGEFVSLMDSEPTLMPSMPSAPTNGKHSHHASFDDVDDLGFGNSKKPQKEDTEDDQPEQPQTAKPAVPASKPTEAQKPAQPEQAPGKHTRIVFRCYY